LTPVLVRLRVLALEDLRALFFALRFAMLAGIVSQMACHASHPASRVGFEPLRAHLRKQPHPASPGRSGGFKFPLPNQFLSRITSSGLTYFWNAAVYAGSCRGPCCGRCLVFGNRFGLTLFPSIICEEFRTLKRCMFMQVFHFHELAHSFAPRRQTNFCVSRALRTLSIATGV